MNVSRLGAGSEMFNVEAGRITDTPMTDLSTTDVQSRTLTAFFDTHETAQKATDDLVAAGIPREHIRINEGAGTTRTTEQPKTTADKGFWDELKDLFIPDEDRYGYAEGLKRGGYLLSVKVDEANYTRATDILDRDGAVDMDEREAGWRSEGWTGYQASSATGYGAATSTTTAAASGAGLALGMGTTATGLSSAETTMSSTAATAKVDTLQSGRDEVIPVYEETAQFAKRDINHGRVRLRSYVVETPVSQQVNLRNESVQIERRPVDRAIGLTDAVFQDRVIEAEEHTEEAFVTKEARIKEEISLRKTVENQAQTVTDTVRRTEVEIEDERTGRGVGTSTTAFSATGSTQILEHMDVIAADGIKIGTVDHMDGPDRFKMAKNTSPDGLHHEVPLSWVDHVDTHVHLNKTLAEIKAGR